MVTILHGVALLGYLVAAVLQTVTFAKGRAQVPRGAMLLIGGAAIVQLCALVAFGVRFGELPLVGLGGAYRAASVGLVGPRRELPSGGLTLHHHRLLAARLFVSAASHLAMS